MRIRFLALSILLIFVFALSLVSAQRELVVGVSPRVLDLGEIEKGSSKVVSFFIITPSKEELLVRLGKQKGTLDFFSANLEYEYIMQNYSEQDVTEWVNILRNPVVLKPQGEEIKTAGGGVVRGWREVDFILKVPEDADNGYHSFIILPSPSVPSGPSTERFETKIVAVTGITGIFRVPGPALRQGSILDIETGGYTGDRLVVNVIFKNTGDTTISARAHTIKLYDLNGTLITELSSAQETLRPGEIKSLVALINPTILETLDSNIYEAEAEVSYTTGTATKTSTIRIPAKPTAKVVAAPSEGVGINVFILASIIVVLGFTLYYVFGRRR